MLGLSPIGDWGITLCRAVNHLSSRQGNENSSCGFKILLGLKVRRGRNGDLGNKKPRCR